jgi:hypothetical protein
MERTYGKYNTREHQIHSRMLSSTFMEREQCADYGEEAEMEAARAAQWHAPLFN